MPDVLVILHKYFICKRFLVPTLLWSLEFMVQIKILFQFYWPHEVKKKTSKAIKFAKFTGHHETSFLVFFLSDRLCKTKFFSVNFYWTFYFLLDFTPLNP